MPVAEEFPGVAVEGEPGMTVLGDPERLRQLVRNLTANAVRAAGPGGVTLRARAADGAVVVEVHDVGPGVPAELQATVFEKFWTSGGGGAGLGPGDRPPDRARPRVRPDAGEPPGRHDLRPAAPRPGGRATTTARDLGLPQRSRLTARGPMS